MNQPDQMLEAQAVETVTEAPAEAASGEPAPETTAPAPPPHLLNTIRVIGFVEGQEDHPPVKLEYDEEGTAIARFTMRIPRNHRGTKFDLANVTLTGKKAEAFYRVATADAVVKIEGALASNLELEPRNRRRSWVMFIAASDFSLMQGTNRPPLNIARLWGYVDPGLEGKGIELRFDESGNAVVEMTVRVPMDRELTSFVHVPVLLWGTLAENAYRNLKPDDYLFLEARFNSRETINRRLKQRKTTYHLSGSLLKSNKQIFRLEMAKK